MEPSPLSRTNKPVDPAGLSLPLPSLSLMPRSKPTRCQSSPPNKLQPVHQTLSHVEEQEDAWDPSLNWLLLTSNSLDTSPRMNGHTLPETETPETASMITMECHQLLDLLDTPFWTPTTRMLSCNILLRLDHLLLQFMPVDGDPTAAVSTTDAATTPTSLSTTPFNLLDTDLMPMVITGSCETAGEPDGVKMVTSD